MIKRIDNSHKYHFYGCLLSFFIGTVFLATRVSSEVDAIDFTNSHLGTFEGDTTYQLSSETDILPTLELEVKKQDGTIERHETSTGSLNLKNTQEGATVKRAILKVNTLVNLSGQLTHHEKWVETGDDLVLNLPSGNGQPHINVGLLYKLKKDTVYTVVINMKLYETGYPHICFMDESNRQLASNREWVPSTAGVLKTKFTTSSTVEAAILRIIPRQGVDNIYTINKNIIILEGDYTNVDIPYFTGMSSVRMPVLRISNQDGSQTATISTEEEITLRSNGEVYDELDLMTGKFTKKFARKPPDLSVGRNGETSC